MARTRNMRYSGPRPKAGQYPAQLGSFSVTATADDVEAFAAQWPGSGFPGKGFTAYFEPNGDLVDLSGWAANFDGDSYALSVLIDEMKEHGLAQQRGRKGNPRRPFPVERISPAPRGWHVIRRGAKYGVAWYLHKVDAEVEAAKMNRANPGQYFVVSDRELTQALMDKRGPRSGNPRRRIKRRRNFASGWRYIRNLPGNYPLTTGSPVARARNPRGSEFTLTLKRVPTDDPMLPRNLRRNRHRDVVAIRNGKIVARWPWYYSNKPRYGQKTVVFDGVRWQARWRK